jgi:hypothetical protein
MPGPASTAAVTIGEPGAPTVIAGDAAAEPEPTKFFAAIRNEYVVPFASPVNDVLSTLGPTDFARSVCATVPMYGVTMYPVSGEPPFDAGAFHDTAACPAPGAAAAFVGAPGTTGTDFAADATDAEPVPTAFVAFTVQV